MWWVVLYRVAVHQKRRNGAAEEIEDDLGELCLYDAFSSGEDGKAIYRLSLSRPES